MILTEKTKNKSYCCKKPIYIEKIGDVDGNYSERPYCSKCLKFPEASPGAIKKVQEILAKGGTEALIKERSKDETLLDTK